MTVVIPEWLAGATVVYMAATGLALIYFVLDRMAIVSYIEKCEKRMQEIQNLAAHIYNDWGSGI